LYATLVHLFEGSCKKFKDRDLFGTKRDGTWHWLKYSEFEQLVAACCGGLAALGVGPGDRVAIVSDNSVEWATCAHATYRRGAAYVPMYTAQKPDEWQFILADCGAKVVFAATDKAYRALKAAQAQLPKLERVIGLHLPEQDPDSYARLLAQGRERPVAAVYPKAEEVAGYIYTSGTTGKPKGVKLSHKNICSNCDAVEQVLPLELERSLAFLPWAHSLGHTADLLYFMQRGFAIGINDDITRLVANLSEVRPTALVAVPRIFNRIYDGINSQMAGKPKVIQALFKRGLAAADRKSKGKGNDLVDRIALVLADKLIFSKVRAKFGGRLKLVICGSAALNQEVAEFVDALGIMVYEGYGLTEASPVVSVNYPGHRRLGSVGKPLPGVRVVLDESKSGQPGEGEVVVYGPNVMLGYHERPEDNAASFTADGGLRTGDLGRFDAEGYLTITGRIKELYKLENGRYVAPAPLEEELKVCPYVANVVLYGSDKPYNVALVVPNQQRLEEWAKAGGVELGNVATNPRVKEHLMAELQKHFQSFKSYERPRDIAIIAEDFTTDNGLLTPKMSVKRKEVVARYQRELDALYAAAPANKDARAELASA
jgi:long-chain acyl-CoA synthetase